MQTAVLPHTGDQIMHAIVWFHGRGLPLSAAKRGSLDSVQSAGSAAERRLSDFDTSLEDAMPTRGGAQHVCVCPKPVMTRYCCSPTARGRLAHASEVSGCPAPLGDQRCG
jgi:hypothetical protein